MTHVDVEITNRLGLHARAAARFVQVAGEFRARVEVVEGGRRVNGKSILGLLTLAAARGTRLRIEADGADAADAVDRLATLVRDGFGEPS